jgi:Tol biopolymer transport system component
MNFLRSIVFVVVSLLASALLALSPHAPSYAQTSPPVTTTSGRFLAYDNSGVFVLDLATGTRFPLGGLSSFARAADWSPDGSKIVVVDWGYDSEFIDLVLFDQAGNLLQRCSDDPACGPLLWDYSMEIRWSPDGSKIAITGGDEDCFGGTLAVIDADFQNYDSLSRLSCISNPNWSLDSKQLIFENFVQEPDSTEAEGVYKVKADGSSPAQLLVENGHNVRLSPAGDRMLLTESVPPAHSGARDLFIRDADGSNPRRLTFNGAIRSAEWSPDGSRIAFVGFDDTPVYPDYYDLYLINPDGSNLVNLADHPGSALAAPVWSPDGTRLAYSFTAFSAPPYSLPVHIIDVNGANLTILADMSAGADYPWQPQANVLSNPGFEVGPIYWRFNTNGQAAFSTASPGFGSPTAGRVAVTQRTSTIQLFQTGVRLEPNTRYRLRFQAYSNSGRDFSVYLHNHTTIVDYGLKNYKVNLTKSWKQFTITFKTKNITEPVGDGRLRFWFGPYARAGDVYWIDNVVLEKAPVTAAASGATGSVTGQVDAALTGGQPATLTLVDLESEGAAFQATATTDASGGFRFDGVPHGEYELRLTAPAEAAAQEAIQLSVSEEENESILFAPLAPEPALFLPVIRQ